MEEPLTRLTSRKVLVLFMLAVAVIVVVVG
jgi:hypothetical protein